MVFSGRGRGRGRGAPRGAPRGRGGGAPFAPKTKMSDLNLEAQASEYLKMASQFDAVAISRARTNDRKAIISSLEKSYKQITTDARRNGVILGKKRYEQLQAFKLASGGYKVERKVTIHEAIGPEDMDKTMDSVVGQTPDNPVFLKGNLTAGQIMKMTQATYMLVNSGDLALAQAALDEEMSGIGVAGVSAKAMLLGLANTFKIYRQNALEVKFPALPAGQAEHQGDYDAARLLAEDIDVKAGVIWQAGGGRNPTNYLMPATAPEDIKELMARYKAGLHAKKYANGWRLLDLVNSNVAIVVGKDAHTAIIIGDVGTKPDVMELPGNPFKLTI